ncbi:hypothetical protein F4775DRAFT_545095 [Biscogniauxia sp. FL1348]|nr:hypothetical protein F4775DRAFT_545095 [Biscogniauxia sp. FL1348]
MATPNCTYMVPLKPKLIPKADSGPHKWTIESTPEIQSCYNKVRADIERHANQNHLHPPATTHYPRSPSDENYLIQSPIHSQSHSPIIGFEDANHGPASQGTTETKRLRGRRRGPLNMQTRINTAFKRKTKLICKDHRAKKIACECFDFTKLEERYPGLQTYESSDRPAILSPATSQSWPPVTSPSDGAPNVDLAGTGGAALISSHRNDEMNELDSPLGLIPTVRSNVHSAATLDIYSAESVAALRQASMGQPYHPGATTHINPEQIPEQLGLLPIGSEMLGFPTRWQCEFQPSADNGSEVSSEVCSWTGPLKDLSIHFQACHSAFEYERYWSKCTHCATLKEGWNGGACTGNNCSRTRWQRWVYGSTVEKSIPVTTPTFTQSGASESGFSWNFDPAWEKLNPSGTELSNGWYNSYSANSSYYDHSSNGYRRPSYHVAGFQYDCPVTPSYPGSSLSP